MNCPYCTSPATKEQSKKTTLGYRTFRCSACHGTFNERSGTPFNYLEYRGRVYAEQSDGMADTEVRAWRRQHPSS